MLPSDRVIFLRDDMKLSFKDAWNIGLYKQVFESFTNEWFFLQSEDERQKIVNTYSNLPKKERKRLMQVV